jgi:hypothetical protein
MIVSVLIEQTWPRPLQEPGAPVYRVGAGQWSTALCMIVAALVLVPAAASAPNTKFVSKQYGYSIVLPGNSSRWFSSFARVTWSTATISPDTSAFDTFTDLRTNRLIVIGARRLPTGSTLEKWTAILPSESRAKLHDTCIALELEALGYTGPPTHVVVHRRLQSHWDHRTPRPPRLLHDRRVTDDQSPRRQPHRLQRRPRVVPLPVEVEALEPTPTEHGAGHFRRRANR